MNFRQDNTKRCASHIAICFTCAFHANINAPVGHIILYHHRTAQSDVLHTYIAICITYAAHANIMHNSGAHNLASPQEHGATTSSSPKQCVENTDVRESMLRVTPFAARTEFERCACNSSGDVKRSALHPSRRTKQRKAAAKRHPKNRRPPRSSLTLSSLAV